MTNKCDFGIAWVGRCNADCEGSKCDKHKDLKCTHCGKPATEECDQTVGPLVCGASLCGDCGHKPGEGWSFNHGPKIKIG